MIQAIETPPKNPEIVFDGLMLGHSFGPLKNLPNAYANESATTAISTNTNKTFAPYNCFTNKIAENPTTKYALMNDITPTLSRLMLPFTS